LRPVKINVKELADAAWFELVEDDTMIMSYDIEAIFVVTARL